MRIITNRRLKPKSRAATLDALIERDGLNCCWCGTECDRSLNPNCDLYPTIEHVRRRCDGGSNHMENLKIACRKCNNSRHSPYWPEERPRGQVLPSIKAKIRARVEQWKQENGVVNNVAPPRTRRYSVERAPTDAKLIKRYQKREAKRLGISWTMVPMPTYSQMLSIAEETGWRNETLAR